MFVMICSLLFVCLCCGADAARRRAEPLGNQVSMRMCQVSGIMIRT